MNDSPLFPGEPLAVPALKPTPSALVLHKPVFIGFLVCLAVLWAMMGLGISSQAVTGWVEGLVLLSGVATTLVALARRLPLQNVLWSATLITGIAATIELVSAATGIPFGPKVFTENLGFKIAGLLPWPLPLFWIVIIINGRGVARLIMRPWRKTNFYGFWVIGLTCLFAVQFDLALEPFATRVVHYWIWKTPRGVWNWYNAPWVNFFSWLVTALFILVFTSPWLINKQPVKQPTDYHPLILWLLLNLFLATGNAIHQMPLAAVAGLAASTIETIYAIRGARW